MAANEALSVVQSMARFVLEHPAIARGYLLTAQQHLEDALRLISWSIGATDTALPVWVGTGAPPERLTKALSSVEDAVAKMLGAARALEALRGGK